MKLIFPDVERMFIFRAFEHLSKFFFGRLRNIAEYIYPWSGDILG